MKKLIISLLVVLLSCSVVATNALAQEQSQALTSSKSKGYKIKSCRLVCKWKHGRKYCYKDCIKCRNFHFIHYRVPLHM